MKIDFAKEHPAHLSQEEKIGWLKWSLKQPHSEMMRKKIEKLLKKIDKGENKDVKKNKADQIPF